MPQQVSENSEYLTEQLITCIGNKRLLQHDVEQELIRIKAELGQDKLACADLFAGSGAVARVMKQHSNLLIANDLERYSCAVNSCYLSDRAEFDGAGYMRYKAALDARIAAGDFTPGIISEHYAPCDDTDIRPGERAFYTRRNALIIDTVRSEIAHMPPHLQRCFLAVLLQQASVHTNTCGVFKGFYKDSATGTGKFGGNSAAALTRILGAITLPVPVLSNFACEVMLFNRDANALCPDLPELDVAYIDPPYNQHPYGSNYFMLNVIADNALDPAQCSRVSGIPRGWNRSRYNRRAQALPALSELLSRINSRYIILSYNSEGFITFDELHSALGALGDVRCRQLKYNAFRGSRNLDARERYVSEYLFVIKKKRL